MKTTDLTLDLQAYVDGELDVKRRSEIERVLQSDTDAQALVEGLRALGKLVRENEPIRSVPASRAFIGRKSNAASNPPKPRTLSVPANPPFDPLSTGFVGSYQPSGSPPSLSLSPFNPRRVALPANPPTPRPSLSTRTQTASPSRGSTNLLICFAHSFTPRTAYYPVC